MRCSKAKEMMALHAGGDLPESKVSRLETHLETCPRCAAEFEKLKKTVTVSGNIAAADKPESLPDDFANQVLNKARQKNPLPGRSYTKPVLAFGMVAVVVLIALFSSGIFREKKIHSLAQWRQDLLSTAGGGSVVAWDDNPQLTEYFQQPIPIEQWVPPGEAGVYAVMHLADPENNPSQFIIDYCGESRKLTPYRGNPWLRRKQDRLLSMAGSADNIYIAVLIMPQSSREDRRMIEETLIEAFTPHFNREKGA